MLLPSYNIQISREINRPHFFPRSGSTSPILSGNVQLQSPKKTYRGLANQATNPTATAGPTVKIYIHHLTPLPPILVLQLPGQWNPYYNPGESIPLWVPRH